MTRFGGSGPRAWGLGAALAVALLGVPAFAQVAPTAPQAVPDADPEVQVVPPPTADEHYDLKVRELEEKVVNLKEKIFRTKTRLLLLKERILNDVIAEAKLVVVHQNEMGASFKPEQVYYRLDGEDLKLLDNATACSAAVTPSRSLAATSRPATTTSRWRWSTAATRPSSAT